MTRRGFLLFSGLRHLTRSLTVAPGPVNSVILTRKGRRLAFYCGGAEQVLLTHFRRDVCCAAADAPAVTAPRAEAGLIADPRNFWHGVDRWRYHDYAMVNTKVLTAPLPVRRTVAGGDRIQWQDVDIEVLDTPGYTPGAVSYLFESGGKRIACVGDLIYGDGQLLDLWSLQDAIPAAKLRGYHGYAARGHELIRSLRAIAARNLDLLIPSRGPVIHNPATAIETLIVRLKTVFREHFSTDALRWYFGDDNLKLRAARLLEGATPEWMPMAEKRGQLPSWLIANGNSRLLLSDSGNGFLVDCGYDKVIQELKRLRQEGRLRALEGIFITHYHDDHTDRAQTCATEFGCPVYYCAEQQPILSQPKAFRMPCLSPFPIRDGKPMRGGEKLRWHEFELTFNYFPGQTLYHGSLLAQRSEGESVLFAGDSFTPSGTDDYCLWNRDFLSPGAGFDACFAQLRKLPPKAWVANQHVAPLFRFSGEQLEYMERSFARRRQALRDLFPWPDVNFGIDHQWARLSPYEIAVRARNGFDLQAVVWNHGPSPREFTVRPRLPPGWTADARQYRLRVAASAEGSVTMRVQAGTTTGQHVVTADVAFGKWEMPQWIEAIVNVD